jgi:hypothetical protein
LVFLLFLIALLKVGKGWTESRPPPKSKFEYMERCGEINSIPPGFTYFPYGGFYRRPEVEFDSNSRYVVPHVPSAWETDEQIPSGASRTPIFESKDPSMFCS